jgi:hypothetical protein
MFAAKWRRFLTVVVLGTMLPAMVATTGCERRARYEQDTPQAVLRSARRMVEDESYHLLPRLIDADNDSMRLALDRLGTTLGRADRVAKAIQQRWPEQVEQIKADLVEAGTNAARDRRMELPGPLRNIDVDAIAVDPFGKLDAWLEKLDTYELAEDRVAITIDNRPALGIAPLILERRDLEWFVVLPLDLPFIREGVPKTEKQWEVIAQMIAVIHNALLELEEDIRAGRVDDLGELPSVFVDKVGLPIGIAFAAYELMRQAESDEP